MAESQSFGGPGSHAGLDRPGSSTSPTSSGVSESPRESSVAFSLITSPTGRLDDLDGGSFFPKTEPADSELGDDQDEDIINVKSEPGEPSSLITTTSGRRPRGRPRKPRQDSITSPKSAKGRSKTGCITCRKRKKKCDERKPTCKNCEQNNVVCEGYPEKSIWRNGKEKAVAKNRQRWEERGARPLPEYLWPVEEDMDWKYYKHYDLELSRRLNISPDNNNPFVEIVIPMAQSHKGVMHALLSCSASHYLHRLKSPEQAEEYKQTFERQRFHEMKAYESIRQEEYPENGTDNNKDIQIICSALLLWLKTIVAGDSNGEWKVHEQYFATLLTKDPQQGEEGTWKFAREFYQYHKMSSFITNADTPEFERPPYLKLTEDSKENFLSICEGLELPTLHIHILRKKIRERRDQKLWPYMSYELMQESYRIDAELKALSDTCGHTVGTPEWICWNLYHNCVWLLLQRSIMAGPHPTPNLLSTVGEALVYLTSVLPNSPIQSVLVMPVFVVGLCAFDESHRPAVLEAFETCEAYSHNGNIRHGRDVLLELWKLMDAHDTSAWDYERVIKSLGVDMLFT